MRLLKLMAFAAGALLASALAYAQTSGPALPRNQTLIVENPEGTIRNAGWFNIWAVTPAASPPACSSWRWTRSGTSIPTTAWTASGTTRWPPSKPNYNADFTEMTVKLRHGIFWSDGVEFTADDVVYTIETQMKTMAWSAAPSSS